MGDLAHDTAVDVVEVVERPAGDGGTVTRLRAALHPDWEIWGPNGGYVAAVALRAAGRASRFARPASLLAHYLGVAEFGPVDLRVEVVRASRRAESLRVSLTQQERPILEALVWAVAELPGLVHDAPGRPLPDGPDGLPTFEERLDATGAEPSAHAFWHNFEYRPIGWVDDGEHRVPTRPESEGWYRFEPTATFADPWVDAARGLILVDTLGWPAATRAHADPLEYYAPSIDLACLFHALAPDSPWLHARAEAPTAGDGLVGCRAEARARDGRLVASAVSTLLCLPAARRPDA